MNFDQASELALALPEVEHTTSYGTPSFKVRRKMLARLREDGETLVVKVDPLEREALLADPSGAYFITPHYQDYPYVLVRLERADAEELRELLIEAWLREAPKRLVAEHEDELLGGPEDD
ncbi:MAG: hypothetical protein GEU88_19315 [Solirubrobacterales bacterium]|nr:hypothetical protein [Solirubrobacterales bacterium]